MNMDGVDTCDLPAASDAHYEDGALIALVLADDLVCDGEMIAWNPEWYIFGCDFITFDDTDGCAAVAEGPAVDIEKATNGMDADEPAGPTVTVGEEVVWTYVVTNVGTVPLSTIVVTDDQGVEVTCPMDALEVGESMACTSFGTAMEGQYANIGIVTATGPDGTEVTDADPSHYFGEIMPSE